MGVVGLYWIAVLGRSTKTVENNCDKAVCNEVEAPHCSVYRNNARNSFDVSLNKRMQELFLSMNCILLFFLAWFVCLIFFCCCQSSVKLGRMSVQFRWLVGNGQFRIQQIPNNSNPNYQFKPVNRTRFLFFTKTSSIGFVRMLRLFCS